MFQAWYGNRLREKMNFGSGRRHEDFYVKRSLQATEILIPSKTVNEFHPTDCS